MKDGEVVDLTFKEFELLLLLVKNKNVALYREIIYEKVCALYLRSDAGIHT